MKIAIDYDDVLIPFMESFLAWYNEREGTELRATDNIDYDLSVAFGHNIQYWVDQINVFHASGASAMTDPFAGALQSIDRLSRDHDLVIMTSRPSIHRAHLEGWVERHAGDVIQDIHMFEGASQHKHTLHHDKGELCKYYGVDLLVDDSPSNVRKTLAQDVQAVMFGNYAWNRRFASEFPEVAHDWVEVESIVNRALKEAR